MSETRPERIWLQPPEANTEHTWHAEQVQDGDAEYIRSDLHRAEVEGLAYNLELPCPKCGKRGILAEGGRDCHIYGLVIKQRDELRAEVARLKAIAIENAELLALGNIDYAEFKAALERGEG